MVTNKPFILLGIALFLSGLFYLVHEQQQHIAQIQTNAILSPKQINVTIPGFDLMDLSGKTITAPHINSSTPILYHFWATWCPPCLTELPALAKLATALGSSSIKVIGISVDQDLQTLKKFLEQHPVPFENYWDGKNQTALLFQTKKYPESFLLDVNGIARYAFIGPKEWQQDIALQQLHTLLNTLQGKQYNAQN